MAAGVNNPAFSPIEQFVLPGTEFHIEGNNWQDGVVESITRFGVEMYVDGCTDNLGLAPRVTNILALNALGLTAGQAAAVLGISAETVRNERYKLAARLMDRPSDKVGVIVEAAFKREVLSMPDVSYDPRASAKYGHVATAAITGVANGLDDMAIAELFRAENPNGPIRQLNDLDKLMAVFCTKRGILSRTGLVHFGHAAGILPNE